MSGFVLCEFVDFLMKVKIRKIINFIFDDDVFQLKVDL